MVNALNMGLTADRVHSAAQAVTEDYGFCFILYSKLEPTQVDLLYVHVINSLHNGFSSWFTAI